jgi:hypothetical protein
VDFAKLKRADSVTPWRLLHRFCGVRARRPRLRLPCPSLHKYGSKWRVSLQGYDGADVWHPCINFGVDQAQSLSLSFLPEKANTLFRLVKMSNHHQEATNCQHMAEALGWCWVQPHPNHGSQCSNSSLALILRRQFAH